MEIRRGSSEGQGARAHLLCNRPSFRLQKICDRLPQDTPHPLLALSVRRYWAFGNDFDWLTFDFDREMDTIDDELAARSNANTADLEEFKSHGGKLILTHGLADPLVPTLNTVAYYERLISSQKREGRRSEEDRNEALRHTQEFVRLFLLPGAAHCSGGAGPYAVEGDPFPAGPNILPRR